jgi:ATP/maltotriose-dependent transcriptional regulator MalT
MSGGQRFAWLSIDSADSDPARFLRYMRVAADWLRTGRQAEPQQLPTAGPHDPDISIADLL